MPSWAPSRGRGSRSLSTAVRSPPLPLPLSLPLLDSDPVALLSRRSKECKPMLLLLPLLRPVAHAAVHATSLLHLGPHTGALRPLASSHSPRPVAWSSLLPSLLSHHHLLLSFCRFEHFTSDFCSFLFMTFEKSCYNFSALQLLNWLVWLPAHYWNFPICILSAMDPMTLLHMPATVKTPPTMAQRLTMKRKKDSLSSRMSRERGEMS